MTQSKSSLDRTEWVFVLMPNLRGPALKMKNVTASGIHTRIIIAYFKTYRSELYRESEVQVILVQTLLFSIPPPF